MRYEVKEDYVLLHAEGVVDTFTLFLQGTKWMYNIIAGTKASKVLLDYQSINFKLDQAEAFNIVRVYEMEMPLLREVKIAAVVGNKNKVLAKVWEEIGRKRGYDVAAFITMEAAKKWLSIK